MSENNMKYLGLCSTCKSASSCTHPRDPDKPVFYCEEFEVEKPTPIRTARKEGQQAAESSVTKDTDAAEFIGLCSNCDNRKTCTFLKPEGGVWHCEEYR
jgi:hypothetical protein